MNLYFGIPLLASILNACLATLVLIKHHRAKVNRLFSLCLGSMALWCITIFAMRVSPDLEHAASWERLVIVMICATSVFFYHFTIVLTDAKSKWKLLLGVCPSNGWFAVGKRE